MAFVRISITLPRDLLTAADRRAKQLDRSRSWVVAEALRRYLAEGDRAQPPGVAEPAAPAYAPGLGSYRRHQLEADLGLTPEQRVREAEQTARASEVGARQRAAERVILFDRYEDYLEWQRREELPW